MRFSEMVFKSLFARIESMTSVYRASTSGDTIAQGMMSVTTEFGAYTRHRMVILRDMSSKSFDFLFFTDPKLEKSELRFEKSLQVGSRVLIRVK
jgi:hypothetical protein